MMFCTLIGNAVALLVQANRRNPPATLVADGMILSGFPPAGLLRRGEKTGP